MKRIHIPLIIALLFVQVLIPTVTNASTLSQNLSGKILLQVESHGEAWYVNPVDSKRYYLGQPADAFNIMRSLGIGITNANLRKLQLAESNFSGTDTDRDGVSDTIEMGFGTNRWAPDSDGDGYNDKTEMLNGYNPLGVGKMGVDSVFADQHKGEIFLQIESMGEAFYVNPNDGKRYFLGNPSNAYNLLTSLGLGISNKDMQEIPIGERAFSILPIR